MLSKITLANGNGEDIVLHEDTNASRRLVAEATGLIETPERRESRRVRPQAHGSINESRYQEGSLITLSGEVWSTVNIEAALEELRKIKQVCQESLDNEGALLKWTEGVAGLKLQKMVKLDSGIDPVLKEAAAFIPYHVQFFAEDPRAYSQTLESKESSVGLTGVASEPEWANMGITGKIKQVCIDSGHIYWIDGERSWIGRAAIGGGTVEREWIKTETPPQALAIDASHIYWGQEAGGTGKVGRAAIGGTGVEQSWLKTNKGTGNVPCAITVTATRVYWATITTGDTVIGWSNFAGTEINTSFLKAKGKPLALTNDGTYLYYGQDGSVGRVELNGKEQRDEYVSTGSASSVNGLAVNASFIYWLSEAGNAVGRAPLGGGESRTRFVSLSSAESVGPSGLAINTEHIYWGAGAFISRSKELAGGGPVGAPVVVKSNGARPTPIVFTIKPGSAALVNPVIVRASDGASITFLGEVAPGETWIVDTNLHTVKANNGESRIQFIYAPATNWRSFEAKPGVSETYELAASSANGAKLLATWRDAY